MKLYRHVVSESKFKISFGYSFKNIYIRDVKELKWQMQMLLIVKYNDIIDIFNPKLSYTGKIILHYSYLLKKSNKTNRTDF